MTGRRDRDYLLGLVRELRRLPHETEWVEFKVDQRVPRAIGEYVSALANAAALHDKTRAYVLWGIEDGTHAVVGTHFSPGAAKKGAELLETWLLRLLSPRIDFRFREVSVDERRVVLLEIDRAAHRPVAFEGVEFIRVGSTKRKLKDYLTNASLRERFGVTTNNKAMVSRRIREAVDAGAIRPFDEHTAPKLRKYVPHWAGVSASGIVDGQRAAPA